MDITSPFLDYLRKFIDLTDEEYQQYLLPYIKVRRFGKKEIITKASEVENHFNFIIKGLARKERMRSIRRSRLKITSYTPRNLFTAGSLLNMPLKLLKRQRWSPLHTMILNGFMTPQKKWNIWDVLSLRIRWL